MMSKRALLVRIDRIGDLCLTLPCESVLTRAGYSEVQWLYPAGLEYIMNAASPSKRGRLVHQKFALLQFWNLWHWIRSQKFSLAIVYHAPWWMSFLILLAGIPKRVGVRSQWHSFLCFNRSLRQRRSLSEKSEFQYNVDLTDFALDQTESSRVIPLRLMPPLQSEVILRRFGLAPKEYIVLHPGMGGSARNWPISYYTELIDRLIFLKIRVVITGTKSDRDFLVPIKNHYIIQETKNPIWVDDQLNGNELLAILSLATRVVAPSTGVIHLAASLGVPVVGLYSPVQAQHPRRWSPQNANPHVQSILFPQVDCPGKNKCIGKECPAYDCMEKVKPEFVEAALAQPTI